MTCKKTRRWTVVFALLIGLMFADGRIANAATPANPGNVAIKVKSVAGDLMLNSKITVEVENLSKYLKQTGKDAKKFALYLDWRLIKGVNSRLIDGEDKLGFDIRRTSENKEVWNTLLGRPFGKDKGFFTYSVPVSVGYENESPISSDVKPTLFVISKTWFFIFLVFFAVALFWFVKLAKSSGIIRDPGFAFDTDENPDTDARQETSSDKNKGSHQKLENRQRPYSLGRTQMAFWFFIVVVSYVFIWMITSDLESITESVLALIGISAATALGAAVVGSSKQNAAKSKHQELEKEKHELLTSQKEEAVPQTEAGSEPATPDESKKDQAEKNPRLAQLEKEIKALEHDIRPSESKGFWSDLLADANGISLHRFQIAIWTVVLGFIFLASIYSNLAMPQFSDTLLALMGISGGTYIGFKFPEKQT